MVLAIALIAALGAAWVAKGIVSAPPEVRQVEKTVGAVDVLVAARDMTGERGRYAIALPHGATRG